LTISKEKYMNWTKQETMRLLTGAPGTHYQNSDDNEKITMRNWVRELLGKQAITVTFTKADGSERQMQCTLNYDRIPDDKHPKPTDTDLAPVDGIVREGKQPKKQTDPHSIRVFDLEKSEWRSFRFDRLKKITADMAFE